MLVELTDRPVGIGTRSPRFCWSVELEGRSRRQSAYQIRVATSLESLACDQPDLWDSGKIDSSASSYIPYEGQPLKSNMDCFWKVQIWDESGKTDGYSAPHYFGTALLDESDWKACWIGMGEATEPKLNPYSISQKDASSGLQLSEEDFSKLPHDLRDFNQELRCPQLRKDFVIPKEIRRAKAYVCGLGLFEFRLNGKKVGEDVLNTPRTDFDKRVYYFAYNITDEIKVGENAVGMILGGGWFNAPKKFWHWQAPWFGSPRALVQIEIEYSDGTKEQVISDESWRGTWSPIEMSCIYDGEDYDATCELEGWDEAGYDPEDWSSVNLVSAPEGRLVPMDFQPNRVMDRWEPVSVTEPEPGVYVYDMGKVMTGWVALNIPQGKAGETVSLRFSELLFDSGMIAPGRSCGKARQTDNYRMKGAKNESYEPRFTYHGFRYVEMRGFPGKPDLENLEACYVYQGVDPVGSFECGNEMINHIHSCTLQSQRCNLQMGVPTDDTQREERLGWSGDAWSYAEESFYNFDVMRFWRKWLEDCCDQQHEEHGALGYITPLPGWGEDLVWTAAFVLIPWWHYLHYGDIKVLRDNYPYMKKYLHYLMKTGKKELPELGDRSPGELLFPECAWEERFSSDAESGHLQHSLFADHLATHEGSGMGKDQPRNMATAFFYKDAVTMVEVAEALGHEEDVAFFRSLAVKIKEAFNEAFYDSGEAMYSGGFQSSQALALCFGLTPDEDRERAKTQLSESMKARGITTGYAGTKWAVSFLGNSGFNDTLWERATTKEKPSWGFMLQPYTEEGVLIDTRTTIPENWRGKASQCHTTLGAAIDEWFYWGLAGIKPDVRGPGYEKMILEPYFPSDLPWVKARLQTLRGTIVSEWKKVEGRIQWDFTVPANSSAKILVPHESIDDILEGGELAKKAEGLQFAGLENGCCIFLSGSGSYRLSWPQAQVSAR